MNGDDRPRRRWNKLRMAGLAAVSGGVVVVGIQAFDHWAVLGDPNALTNGQHDGEPFMKFVMPGIDRPRVVAAGQSKLRPDETVLGFVVAGRARAYRLDGLRDRSTHVVNDVVGDIPISVSFCDINNCIRAYTGRPRQGPLGIAVGGLLRGQELILDVGGTLYFQENGKPYRPKVATGDLPLERIEPTVTTWGEWRRDHPDSDVYEGVK